MDWEAQQNGMRAKQEHKGKKERGRERKSLAQ
jgi:hypothetical protein